MGLLKKAMEQIASTAFVDALEIPIKVLEKAIEKSEAAEEKYVSKLFKKEPGTEVLIINRHLYTRRKDVFDVYGENQEVKYTVIGKLSSSRKHMQINNAKGKKLGTIKGLPVTLAKRFKGEVAFEDYVIEIGGKKLGTVKSKRAFSKQKYEVGFNGWHIEGNILGWKFKILDGEKEMANISHKIFSFDDIYTIAFRDSQNELTVLLLVLALVAANEPEKPKFFGNGGSRTIRVESQ